EPWLVFPTRCIGCVQGNLKGRQSKVATSLFDLAIFEMRMNGTSVIKTSSDLYVRTKSGVRSGVQKWLKSWRPLPGVNVNQVRAIAGIAAATMLVGLSWLSVRPAVRTA